jgi:hypothetical protein
MGFLVCSLVLSIASFAAAGVPDLGLSSATTAAGAQVSVYTLPDGVGDPLTDCYLYGGSKTDATITLTLLDANSEPVYLFPFEDLWLETTMGGLVLCTGGSTADASTNAAGVTTWTGTVRGGGYSADGELTQIYVAGDPLEQAGLDMLWNSPDIDGNGVVALADVILFSQDYNSGTVVYRSNLYWDDVLDLADVIRLADGLGSACP